jgi:hypothetical protein
MLEIAGPHDLRGSRNPGMAIGSFAEAARHCVDVATATLTDSRCNARRRSLRNG